SGRRGLRGAAHPARPGRHRSLEGDDRPGRAVGRATPRTRLRGRRRAVHRGLALDVARSDARADRLGPEVALRLRDGTNRQVESALPWLYSRPEHDSPGCVAARAREAESTRRNEERLTT